jgi:hypothetical protein
MAQNYSTLTLHMLWISFWKVVSYLILPYGFVILLDNNQIEVNEKKY